MASTEYHLSRLRVVYCARLKWELENTVSKLRKSLEWLPEANWPMPQRLGRRQRRVNYIKGPKNSGRTIRHYVFFDHRYMFTFHNVKDPQPIMSTVLGAMDGDTNCVVDFSWHHAGSGRFAPKEEDHMAQRLQAGYDALTKQAEPIKYGKQMFAYHKKFWNHGFCGPNIATTKGMQN